MRIQNIDESVFNQIEGIRQIIAHDHARRFASIQFDGLGEYGLSWRSDLFEPMVEFSPDHTAAWIGIDQQLVAIDLRKGRTFVALPLTSYLVQILTLSSLTGVLTELDVSIFNLDGSIRFIKGLPEIGSEISAQNNNLIIRLLEGGTWVVDAETGVLKEPAITA